MAGTRFRGLSRVSHVSVVTCHMTMILSAPAGKAAPFASAITLGPLLAGLLQHRQHAIAAESRSVRSDVKQGPSGQEHTAAGVPSCFGALW